MKIRKMTSDEDDVIQQQLFEQLSLARRFASVSSSADVSLNRPTSKQNRGEKKQWTVLFGVLNVAQRRQP